jgi:VIT1/CCC1 family predicted Fe2+/Mn2+ transporter
VGAALPLVLTWLSPPASVVPTVAGGSLVLLAVLGGMAARAGGANVAIGGGRVALWGALAMAATAAVGKAFGAVV